MNVLYNMRCFIKELGPVRAYRRVRFDRRMLAEENADKVLKARFGETLTAEEKAAYKEKMFAAAKNYRIPYDEYFLFHVEEKTPEECKDFISDLERIDICERWNRAKNQAIFDNKEMTYRYFKPFFHRTLKTVKGETAEAEIRAFLKEYGSAVVKPMDGTCGRGVQIVDVENAAGMQAFLNSYAETYKNGAILEEKIRQSAETARLHPASVNTVRVPTLRIGDRVEVIYPFLRIGRGNAVVDNAGAGGLICVADPKTGVVYAAVDEVGTHYEAHPETGVPLIGYQIPRWEEAVAFVKQLADVVPTNRYTGWDIALTEDGWVMVEGNARGQFVWQYATEQGCRKELEALTGETL